MLRIHFIVSGGDIKRKRNLSEWLKKASINTIPMCVRNMAFDFFMAKLLIMTRIVKVRFTFYTLEMVFYVCPSA